MLKSDRKACYADVGTDSLQWGMSGISWEVTILSVNRLEVGADTWEHGVTYVRERCPWFFCFLLPNLISAVFCEMAIFCWSYARKELRLEIPPPQASTIP